jgi:hypothetical protein
VSAERTDEDDDLDSVRLVGLAQPATVVAGTTSEGAALTSVPWVSVGSANDCASVRKCEFVALASDRSFGVGAASHCGGGHDRRGRCSGLCTLGRGWLSQLLWWRSQQVRALLWPVIPRSELAQPDTAVAGTTGEDAVLASVRSVVDGSASHCGGGHER